MYSRDTGRGNSREGGWGGGNLVTLRLEQPRAALRALQLKRRLQHLVRACRACAIRGTALRAPPQLGHHLVHLCLDRENRNTLQ